MPPGTCSRYQLACCCAPRLAGLCTGKPGPGIATPQVGQLWVESVQVFFPALNSRVDWAVHSCVQLVAASDPVDSSWLGAGGLHSRALHPGCK